MDMVRCSGMGIGLSEIGNYKIISNDHEIEMACCAL